MIHAIEHERIINPFQFFDSRSKAQKIGVFQCDMVNQCQSYSCEWDSDCRSPHQCYCNVTKFCHRHAVKSFNVYEMDTSAVNRFVVFGRYCEDSANKSAEETVCLNNRVMIKFGR